MNNIIIPEGFDKTIIDKWVGKQEVLDHNYDEKKGSLYVLTEKAGKCVAVYDVEASFGLLVPGAIAKTLVSVNLPLMMANFKKRVKEVYGK